MTAYLRILSAAILRPEKRQGLRVTTQLKSEFCKHGGESSQGKSLVLSQLFEYGAQYYSHISWNETGSRIYGKSTRKWTQ